MKKYYKIGFSTLLLTTLSFSNSDHHKSKYAEEADREIKSLSINDIKELKKGSGWGLAKAAELNGYPGPSHILKMAKEINLTKEQIIAIQKMFDEMKAQSISLGNQLIQLEKKLNNDFQNKTIDQTKLHNHINDISDIRQKLRLTHLSTHLKTPNILTQEQVSLYNNLRGYTKKGPCLSVPEGHDVKIWKKHNKCK